MLHVWPTRAFYALNNIDFTSCIHSYISGIRFSCWNIYYAFIEIFHSFSFLLKLLNILVLFLYVYLSLVCVCMIDILTFWYYSFGICDFTERSASLFDCMHFVWMREKETEKGHTMRLPQGKQAISNVNMTWKIIKIFRFGSDHGGPLAITVSIYRLVRTTEIWIGFESNCPPCEHACRLASPAMEFDVRSSMKNWLEFRSSCIFSQPLMWTLCAISRILVDWCWPFWYGNGHL